ncbi:hypothetical protein LTR84_003495 [Exophiala bonariae]|uniref:DUF7580 domain-containing protein n=1 Tax=Exophiala bonariae TaxID=1690606 RepID=A0AAV9N9X6_9EURO|nr:hypothetical protein LTR84_003495 [Exophiala bonariae]
MAEVAGLVLSAVPILAALQQYGTVHKLCKRFRKCKSGIDELIHCLYMQQVIFSNETRLLLTSVVGMDRATAMLQDLKHASWSDPKFSSQLDSVLGDSKQAIVAAAQSAHKKMREFEDDVQKLEAANSGARTGSKEWRKALRAQFKFTFTESNLTRLACSITQATTDYRVLRAQLQEYLASSPDIDSSGRSSLEVERIQATQDAATRVYEILVTACKLHSKHHARFSLTPNYVSSSMGTEIKFQIAYRHLSSTQAQTQRDVLWFVVESIINSTINTRALTIAPLLTTGSQKSTSKRPLSPILKTLQLGSCTGAKAKRVRIRSPSPPAVSGPSIAVGPLTLPNLPEFSKTNNLCTHLRACTNKHHPVGVCIGWLENSTQWKHRVFHSLGPSTPKALNNEEVETLAGLLTSLTSSRKVNSRLTVLQRLRLAKLLSTAMLNFNATPWMPPLWSSQDIVVYDVPQTGENDPKGLEVFVEVPVQPTESLNPSGNSTNPGPPVVNPAQPTMSMSQPAAFDTLAPWVRNLTLFGLGVMLLEIAFEAPLQSMRTASDVIHGYPAAIVDLFTARRQSEEVATGLGLKYSEIVKKCLHCDFGQGADLSNPGLQNAIHRDVISELDRLEAGFQQLGIQ